MIERDLVVNGTPGRPMCTYKICTITGSENGKLTFYKKIEIEFSFWQILMCGSNEISRSWN